MTALPHAADGHGPPTASPLGRQLADAARDFAARRLLQPIHRLYRASRPVTRSAYQANAAGLAFRARAEAWSEEERERWVLERLRTVVRYAYHTSPFHRARLDAAGFDPRADFTFADYAALPVLERADVAAAGRSIVSSAVPPELLRADATGGSTGTPTRLWKGPEERGWNESASTYCFRRIGIPPGARMAYLWGHHLDATTRASLRERVEDLTNNSRWFDCFRLTPELLQQYHQELCAWRPHAMVAYAGALAALAEAVDGRAGRDRYPRHAFVTGAEKLHDVQREVIERVFGRPVHERYGSRDVGLIGFQFAPWETRDFTVDWAKVFVEPDGADPATAGILVTKLRADGMPMLRYRIGDVARFPTTARPGHPAFVLHEVLGRDMDRLVLPGGRWLHPVALPHLMKDHPVRDWQVHQAADLAVTIRVVPAPEYTDGAARAIVDTVRSNLPGLPVRLEAVAEIPRTRAGKWRPVLSEAASLTPST